MIRKKVENENKQTNILHVICMCNFHIIIKKHYCVSFQVLTVVNVKMTVS